MVGPEFASCWLKIARAEEHFRAVQEKLLAWRDVEPYTVRKEYDPKSGRHSLRIGISSNAPFDDMALIAGDCAHNVRCALDHLTYVLAIRDTGINPPVDGEILQFPICDSEVEFNKKSWRIKSLSKATQKLLESVQPYNCRHVALPSILGVLNVFENRDKHRLIHIAYSQNVSGKITFMGPPNWIAPSITWLHEPLEDGKEFAYFTADPPNPDIQYGFEVALSVTVSHIPGPSGVSSSPVESVLRGMLEEAKRIINRAILV